MQELLASGHRLTIQEQKDEYKKIVQKIAPLVGDAGVSIEVFADLDTAAEQMFTQGQEMFSGIPNAYIKYPCTHEGVRAAQMSVKTDIRVNVNDRGVNGMDVVRNILKMHQAGDHHVHVLAARAAASFSRAELTKAVKTITGTPTPSVCPTFFCTLPGGFRLALRESSWDFDNPPAFSDGTSLRGSRHSCATSCVMRRILSQEARYMSEHSRHAESHIDSIVKQEEEALERRSPSERLADKLGVFAGSFPFVMLHLVLVTGWLLVNSGKISGVQAFDPYPFSLLGVIVAIEAVILSSFILMRQNRMMRRGEHRDHLNLQVDLLAEKEITTLLQMVRAICGRLGLQDITADKDIRELSQNTSIESLSQSLEDKLPGN